ncbi:MAG: hypothetical protein QOE23_335 [Pseudonocardiales bacterium]|jgi:hypothetical protein|nr:hypothetical protein [Pseudonocardiales bacterium]
MFNSMPGDLGRSRQADLIARAQHQRLVREARGGRRRPARHLLAMALQVAADRMEPIGARVGRETGSVHADLPCAVSPC